MRFLLLSLLVILHLGLRAAFVSPQEAKVVAHHFLTSIRQPGSTVSVAAVTPFPENEEIASIYIIHLEPAGFIMVSADDCSYPLLAYSLESNYTVEDQPENFQGWIQGYSHQIRYATENNIGPDRKTMAAWKQLRAGAFAKSASAAVAPLLVSTWDQGNPYNYLCPEDAGGSGGHVWAGCVATAMSQVLYYWRYPLQGSSDHGYYSDYGYLFADFGNTQYKWEQMTNKAVSRNFEMAQLQSHLGIGVNMMYGAGGSGAYSEDAAYALITYFGMNPGLHLEYAPDPIDESWKSLIRSQLDAGYPLYYHGFGSGGHAFNVDGYENNDYFHFNWGWSGSFNGYYYLENLNPGGNIFTYGQGAIIDAYPAANYPYYCNSTVTLTSLEGSIEDGSGPVSPYTSSLNCGWLIAPEGDSVSEIKLTFHRFDLQNTDYVRIFDGADTTANLLGTYTGNNLPPVLTSSGNRMFLKFTTNSAGNAGGWFATYTAIKTVYCSGTTTLTAPSGSIGDGSGPYDYRENTQCRFRITPENATSISLSFHEFNTFDEGDFLAVFNLENNLLLAKLFGNINPGTLSFNTGKLQLVFHTNTADNGAGWNLDYTSVIQTNAGDPVANDGLKLFPNPASAWIDLSFDKQDWQCSSIRIYAADGRMISKLDLSPGTTSFHEIMDVSGYAPGFYSLQLDTSRGIVARRFSISR